jgi:hypothetical protein
VYYIDNQINNGAKQMATINKTNNTLKAISGFCAVEVVFNEAGDRATCNDVSFEIDYAVFPLQHNAIAKLYCATSGRLLATAKYNESVKLMTLSLEDGTVKHAKPSSHNLLKAGDKYYTKAFTGVMLKAAN